MMYYIICSDTQFNTIQMAALAFNDIIRSQYMGHQALVTLRKWDPTWTGQYEYTKEQSHV